MLFADCNYDTRADKSSVALARPSLCSWIVIEQFVEVLPRLHFIEPFLLGSTFLESAQKLVGRFHRHSECALRENHHAASVHGHENTPELREQIKQMLKDERD